MSLLLAAVVFVLLIAPPLTGLIGLTRPRHTPAAAAPWDWKLTAISALLYALAFNLTFFLQELFLVLPKALVPGLEPTLYHNNHDWNGRNPIAELLQGTGATAILTSGLVCAAITALRPPRSRTVGLLLFWLAFHGLFMSLAQVVVAAFVAQNDVARGLTWLGIGDGGKTVAALCALAAITGGSLWLGPHLLALAAVDGEIDGPARRTRFVFTAGTLPAIVGTLLILPFRMPGHVIEVAIVPVAVAIAGMGWMQATAWAMAPGRAGRDSASPIRIVPALIALAALLAVFQLVLRPGIAFY